MDMCILCVQKPYHTYKDGKHLTKKGLGSPKVRKSRLENILHLYFIINLLLENNTTNHNKTKYISNKIQN